MGLLRPTPRSLKKGVNDGNRACADDLYQYERRYPTLVGMDRVRSKPGIASMHCHLSRDEQMNDHVMPAEDFLALTKSEQEMYNAIEKIMSITDEDPVCVEEADDLLLK